MPDADYEAAGAAIARGPDAMRDADVILKVRRPTVAEAERYTIETAHRLGIPARAEIRDAGGARRYVEMGVQHFCVGWDVRIRRLARWIKQSRRCRKIRRNIRSRWRRTNRRRDRRRRVGGRPCRGGRGTCPGIVRRVEATFVGSPNR